MIWARWAIERLGYVVRPYDMLADRRRWFWQPRTTCADWWRGQTIVRWNPDTRRWIR